MKWIIGIIILSVLVWGGVMIFKNKKTADPSQAVVGTTVTIKNFAFSPDDLQVKMGDTVTFKNEDSIAHTVTSDTKDFDSGSIAPGAIYTHKFDKAGTFAYHCSIHQSMKAKVEVK